jgi:hypothetical protein
MKYIFLCAVLIFAAQTNLVFAQHEGHTMPPAKPAATPGAKPAPSPQMRENADEPMRMDHGVLVMP